MENDKSSERCVHCCKVSSAWNWDHVFPRSWYPENTPMNLEKWKVPACVTCNSEYGKIEREFLLKFAMCADPTIDGMQDLISRGMRSADPTAGKNEKDVASRQKMYEKLMNEMLIFDDLQEGLIPDFSTNDLASYAEKNAVRIPQEKLFKLIRKFVRGMFYLDGKGYIEDDNSIKVYLLGHGDAEKIEKTIEHYGVKTEHGPGFVVRRAYAVDKPRVGLYSIDLWQQRKFFSKFEGESI